jgi:hypothetical protein
MIYRSGWCPTETAVPAIAYKDGLALSGREFAGFFWIAATQDMGNLLLNSLADQWITLVTTIPQSCPCVANRFCCLLTLLAAKQRAMTRLLPREWCIAVLADTNFIVFVHPIFPGGMLREPQQTLFLRES